MVTAQTVVAALAMAASSMTVASAGTCSNTMMNASFNRYTSGSFTQWTRAGAEQEFPTGLRCPPRSPCFVNFLSIFPSSQYLVLQLAAKHQHERRAVALRTSWVPWKHNGAD